MSPAETSTVTLRHVIAFVRLFLDPPDRTTLQHLGGPWRHWELFSDVPLVAPRPPMRRRLVGFGKLNQNLTIRHSTPSPYFILHKAWDFMTPPDRFRVAAAAPGMKAYAKLRRSAASVSITCLRDPRPPPETFTGLQRDRAWRVAVALIRFDMNFGDLVRWLEGEYTNAHRDWTKVSDALTAVRDIDPPPGYPRVDSDRAYRACTEGVPLAGDYECSFESVRDRNLYDNHPGLESVYEEVRTRFAKEEAQCFHLALPRFLWRFLCGIHLAALVWAIRKGRGRLCVDPSTKLSDTDDGYANRNIPDPGTPGREDECPAIYYSSALHRHLTHIWNLRISYPRSDLLQYVDDLHAAFHRLLYHPDGMLIFAAVFMEFLILPVGTIFGARNSPSFFCLLSESRAHLASNRRYRPNDDPEHLTPLANRVRLVPDLTDKERTNLVPARADKKHQGVTPELALRYHNSTFVDDNGLAELREKVLGAIDNSIRAAYDIFGHPDDDRRAPCLSEEKWQELCSFAMAYLGFSICTRQMVMMWPVEKRQQLATLLDSLLARSPCIVTPKESSSLLGLLRNAAPVAPLGVFLSLRVQYALNDGVARAWEDKSTRPPNWWRRWYRATRLLLQRHTTQDLSLLRSTLDDNPYHPVWSRYIGLIVDRSPTHTARSDASYGGLGAWSDDFNFKWRLYRDDLVSAGFAMKLIDNDTQEPIGSQAEQGEHINLLEFVAIIIEFWFIVRRIMMLGPIIGGYIISILADNTSALSWMRYAARSHRPAVRDLSRFLLALTLACPIPFKHSGKHLPGIDNHGADALSRPKDYPTWASATAQQSQLETCQAYRVPFKLLSVIATIISSAKTGEVYEPPTTALLTLELVTLSTGYKGSGSHSSLSRGSHRSRRSR